jgi:5-methylcytosine-specific restriction protein A
MNQPEPLESIVARLPANRRTLGAVALRQHLGRQRGECSWCGRDVPRRRRFWCGPACVREYRLRFDPGFIRAEVYSRDRGTCHKCGQRGPWQADHIVAVVLGGARLGMDNLRTLCLACHAVATAQLARDRRESA